MVLSLTAPSAPPSSVTVTSVTSSTISVQWGSVPCIHQNGDITGYSVQYEVMGSGNTQTEMVSGDSSGGMTTISGLTPSTTYSIELAAVNSAGTGVFSNSQTAMTLGKKIGFRLESNILIVVVYSCSSSPDSRLHNSHLHLPLLD